MDPGGESLILAVCTHNRTRSVLMECLLGMHLNKLGYKSTVGSAGTNAQPLPPIAGVDVQLQRFGLRSPQRVGRQVDGDLVESASLIVTAEPDHVVWIAGQWPHLFPRTFTLLELVEYGNQIGPQGSSSLAEWLDDVSKLRPAVRTYLDRRSIPSIADPTGGPLAAWTEVTDQIDRACRHLASYLG
ncbi:MAG: low molecular weight phosphatase family protein [Ilumatobacteraceae bacterium]